MTYPIDSFEAGRLAANARMYEPNELLDMAADLFRERPAGVGPAARPYPRPEHRPQGHARPVPRRCPRSPHPRRPPVRGLTRKEPTCPRPQHSPASSWSSRPRP